MSLSWLRTVFVAGIVALCVALPAAALDVPPAPTDIPVVDTTGTLSDEHKQQLAATIAQQREATGNQIAVLMIPSLEGESLEEYSIEVARAWGIGGEERDSGVLLFIAKDDRELRIEVGYGLEGALTDIRSGQIIRNRITPEFQKDDFYAGISSGVEGIVAAINGEADPQAQTDRGGNSPGLSEIIQFAAVAGFFGIAWLGSILGRTKSWWAGGVVGGVIGVVIGFFVGFLFLGIGLIVVLTLVGLIFDKVVSDNYKSHVGQGDFPSWWAGGTHLGGGPNGGGFGGFGGGGFGGGGSSGSW